MKGFTCPTQVTATRPLVDGCMSITMHTGELPDVEKMAVIKHLNSTGWLLYRENEIKEEEIPKEDSDVHPKTKSQRQRGVLYRVWEQHFQEKMTFDDYYKTEMERIINHYKSKLD